MTKLTTAQKQQLITNKYVKNVKLDTIRFTDKFKEIFAEELVKNQSPKEIFKNNGLDSNLIGDIRIKNFTRSIKKKLIKNNSMKDDHKYKGRKPHIKAKNYENMDDQEKIKILEAEILEQEQISELLKKISEIEA